MHDQKTRIPPCGLPVKSQSEAKGPLTMALTIHLKPEVEARLAAQAQAKGVSVAEYVGSLLEQFTPTGHQMTPEQRNRPLLTDLLERFIPRCDCMFQLAHHRSYTRKVPGRSALLAGFVMTGARPKASTKRGFATKV